MEYICMLKLKRKLILNLCAVLFCFILIPVDAAALEFISSETYFPNKIELISGKSIVIKSSIPISRVSVGVDVVATFILLSPYEIYLTGNATGITNMIFWQDKKVAAIYDIEVKYDIGCLKRVLHEQIPEEKEYQVYATRDSITLTGKVSTNEKLSKILSLVQSYAGYIIKVEEQSKETGDTKVKWSREARKINNLLQVGGMHQVMLEVRIAEMSRGLTRRLGFNFAYAVKNQFGMTSIGGLSQVGQPMNAGSTEIINPFPISFSPAVNALFRFSAWGGTLMSLVDALKEEGLVKILAEPTLIALSGQTASFHAGGEFPIPVPQENNTTIEFKEFGVRLSFTPMVLSKNRISIKVSPEVSSIDSSNSVTTAGFVIPGLRVRRASTHVELADGQSFAIAGLLNEEARDNLSKYPYLGDIPILGKLFQSKAFQSAETELVIIATPHIVKPLDMTKQTLPTDFYIIPDDTEFFLKGLIKGKPKKDVTHKNTGQMDGTFGHEIPIAK